MFTFGLAPMGTANSTQEIDAPGSAPDTQILKLRSPSVQRPPAKPPVPAPASAPEPVQPEPVPVSESPPAAPQVEAVGRSKIEIETSPEESSQLSLFLAVNSWLVSMAIHMVAFLALALVASFVVQPQLPPVSAFIESALSQDVPLDTMETARFEVVELKSPDFTPADVASVALTSEGVGLGDGGGFGGLGSGPALEVPQVSVQAEIGELFGGPGRKAMGSSIGSDAKSTAQFFGVKATGRRFVFIVDSSNSMRGAKFAAAKEELMYAIRRLSKDQAFYIIFFDANSERMLLMPDREPPLLPVPATADNIQRVEYWINSVQNELKTNPFESVKFALEMVPDAIYLLTDGKFTDRGQTERFLKANNLSNDPVDGYRPKVVIHTICFGQGGEETLKAIAKEYGGTYRSVPVGKK